MGVWDTPMYGIDDESTAAAGERGARWGGRIRDARAYRRAGQDRFSLDDASAVLNGGQGPIIDERARMGAVARSRAEVGDIAGRNEIVDQQNAERSADATNSAREFGNWEQMAPYAVNVIRGSRGFDPERRRAVLMQNAQRFRAMGFSDEQIQAGIAGLTDPNPETRAQWEQELVTGLTQPPEPQVSEQTGDIYTIDPVTQAPTVTGQVPGADMIRRGTAADVATQERAAREPYSDGRGGGGVQYRPVTAEEAEAYSLPNGGRGYVMGSNGRPMAATSGGGVFPADQRARVAITFEPALEAVRTLDQMENLDRPQGSRAQSYRVGHDWGAAAIDALDFGTGILDAPARMIGGADINAPDRGDYGRYRSASSAFEASILPILSGAAVSESEARRTVRAALPQVGDSDQVLRDKARRRRQMVNGAALIGGRPPPFPQDGVPAWASNAVSAVASVPPDVGGGIGLEHLSDEELDALEQELTNGGR